MVGLNLSNQPLIPNTLIYKKNEIRATVSNIFICFGGADPQNYTEAVLDIITKNYYKNYSFTVVLGRAKANVKSIFEKYGKYSNIITGSFSIFRAVKRIKFTNTRSI